ncbi:MAG TPA: HEPN domain-containing protein, partial [Vicinamibacterales bacterium]
MDEGVYERDVLPQLRSAIPKNVGSDHRQALNKRLGFGNEVSFGRRLRTLVKEHETALSAAVPDPCGWVQTIVDYRNGFTHHPVADETLPDRDKIELIQCNYVLQILLELCFLKSMALEEEAIAALARPCDRYRKIKERFFRDEAAKNLG